MKTVDKKIEVVALKKTLTFHVVSPDYQVRTEAKVISGLVQSFVDNKIENNFANGTVRPAKVSQFTIVDADTTNIDKTVNDYIDANIDTIVNPVAQKGM